jgi:hypothetical protein
MRAMADHDGVEVRSRRTLTRANELRNCGSLAAGHPTHLNLTFGVLRPSPAWAGVHSFTFLSGDPELRFLKWWDAPSTKTLAMTLTLNDLRLDCPRYLLPSWGARLRNFFRLLVLHLLRDSLCPVEGSHFWRQFEASVDLASIALILH